MDRFLDAQAEFLKALSHPTRLRLVNRLLGGERSVCELTADTALEQANISQHLSVLRTQGIVEARRRGARTLYRLSRPEVGQILARVVDALAARFEEGNAVYEDYNESRLVIDACRNR